ncbi:DUF309 domain-containing protein [Phormidium sp. FACHB-1136]|jgi:predicted metal-dependent hydrolase|uniref:DUF309 domain-containing protein n=1 Tax=Phormidium sp. FACHB-1136 TaxID=2692848 RepID=UPI001681C9FE|nr:DUF309 domain-containing protein [Phormidium sp. FACHB-1136]MBD2424649.1 DUF309 domain-containing protein [Phormidium sp. FACHB-1136]
MPDFITPDPPAEPCPEVSLTAGIALFNQGQYYDCHDVLEAIWMEAESMEKPFYQGILQVAVGLYHLGNQNWRGATILLGEGVNRLRPFEPSYGGVAVADLVDLGWAWLVALQHTGIDRVADLAQSLAQTQQTGMPQVVTVADQSMTLPVPVIGMTEPTAA